MELAYDELYGLTPRSFNNKLKGRQSIKEELLREGWEQTRTLMIAVLTPHSKKTLKAKDIYPFPWDTEYAKQNMTIATPEQIAKDVARHKRILLKKKG